MIKKPIYCEDCGKKLIEEPPHDVVKYNTQTGKPCLTMRTITLVCPDEDNCGYMWGHTFKVR